ncbi:MAG: hypothetical protein RXO43_02695 [Candidatus Micrarchaeota archaeon]|jgi:hypothetical protein
MVDDSKERKSDEDIETLKRYNQLYLEIIMRYKEYIEENENLYVAELPKLITPDNESVVGLANKIKSQFPIYNYNENFPDAVRIAYSYVKDNILLVNLPIQFWLKPEEVIRCGAGDIFDKATLLCSLIIALGNVSTKLIIKVEENEREFVVYSEFNNGIIAVDLERGVKEYKSREELLKAMGVYKENEEMNVYEFNDKMYNSII